MNIFSVLDDSDNDEPKVTPQQKGKSKATPAPAPSKATPPAPTKTETKPDSKQPKNKEDPKEAAKEVAPKKETKESSKPAAPAGGDFVEAFDGKASQRGGAGRGKGRERERKTKEAETKNWHDHHAQRNPKNSDGKLLKGKGRKEETGGIGSVQQLAQEAEKDPLSVEAEVEVVEEAAEEAPSTPEPPKEVVDTRLTYDQYLALRNEARSASTILSTQSQIRQVNSTDLKGKEDELPETNTFSPATISERLAAKSHKTTQRSVNKTVANDLFSSTPSVPETTFEPRKERFNGNRDNRAGRPNGGRKGGKLDLNDSSLFPSL